MPNRPFRRGRAAVGTLSTPSGAARHGAHLVPLVPRRSIIRHSGRSVDLTAIIAVCHAVKRIILIFPYFLVQSHNRRCGILSHHQQTGCGLSNGGRLVELAKTFELRILTLEKSVARSPIRQVGRSDPSRSGSTGFGRLSTIGRAACGWRTRGSRALDRKRGPSGRHCYWIQRPRTGWLDRRD